MVSYYFGLFIMLGKRAGHLPITVKLTVGSVWEGSFVIFEVKKEVWNCKGRCSFLRIRSRRSIEFSSCIFYSQIILHLTMDGRKRLSTYKRRGAVSQDERRRKLADQRRKVQDDKRLHAIEERRGLKMPEAAATASFTPAQSRVQKLMEWKKKKSVVKNKVADSNCKPAFKVYSKVIYDDTHLYKPPESTKFNPPKGVVAIKSTVPQRQLRSQSKKNGPSKAVTAALKDFASAMKIKNVQNKKKVDSDMLNRTFDTPSDSTGNQSEVHILSEMGVPKQTSEITDCYQEYGTVQSDPYISESVTKGFSTNVKDHGESLTSTENSNFESISISAGSAIRNTRSKSVRKSKKASLKVNADVENENNPIHDHVLLEDCNGDDLNQDKVETPSTNEKSSEYFRSLHKQAADKLSNLCSEWDKLKSDDMPETVKDRIDVAIGYAKLLRSQRLQQYAELISEHENKTNETELKVLSSDLEGFWNIVNNQLNDIYRKFEELSSLKENDWKSPLQKAQQRKLKPIAIKPNKAKGKTTSGLRSFLAKARSKVKDENDVGNLVSLLDHTDDILQGPLLKPMSPIVMKVALRAKQIGSPKVDNSPARSPLKNANRPQVTFTPLSEKKTQGRKTKNFTPGLTPLRRSTRLAGNLSEDID